jgi:photosystem II stability/assembly factor-like uncharacterized protein
MEVAYTVLSRLAVITAVALAAAGSASSRSADYGLLQRFAPQSATTWWAIVQSNLTARTWLMRTVDSGGHWQDVTPPVKIVASSAFVGSRAAWIEAGALRPGRMEPLYRTFDGGRTWRHVGTVQSECDLDFVDLRHGWCVAIGGALGSETVDVSRTVNGGSTWTPVSHTGIGDRGSTAGALPFGCDKTIAFTSAQVGWAAQYCAGGTPHLFSSRDAGARWRPLGAIPLPKRISSPAGEGLSQPALSGSRITVSVDVGGGPLGATFIAASQNDGKSWRTQLVPGVLRYWTVDLIDVRHWILGDGTTLISTADAGRRWHSWTPSVRMKDNVGAQLSLRFLSPRLGFAIPDGNGGPLWWTQDGGATWRPIRITAGPFTVPRA